MRVIFLLAEKRMTFPGLGGPKEEEGEEEEEEEEDDRLGIASVSDRLRSGIS